MYNFTTEEKKILYNIDNEDVTLGPMVNSLVLIVKISSKCNLHCKYCDADIYSNKLLEFNTLAKIIKKSFEVSNRVNFIWHGGEPLIAGIYYYKKIIALQNLYKKDGQEVLNSVQTNGVLLNNEWLNFFKENKFGYGISLDGPEELHNKNRVFNNNSGSFEKVNNAISLVKQNNQNIGVIAVVSENTLSIKPEDFLNFYIEKGITNLALNWQKPAVNIDKTEHISRDKYSDYINELFDVWYKRNKADISIREFDSIIQILLGNSSQFCILAGKCIGKYFGIDPEGNLYHCDEFMFDKKYIIGNINDCSFFDAINSFKIKSMFEENKKNIDALKCKWLPLCKGGCPKDRYTLSITNKNIVECCGWSRIFDHIDMRIKETMSKNR